MPQASLGGSANPSRQERAITPPSCTVPEWPHAAVSERSDVAVIPVVRPIIPSGCAWQGAPNRRLREPSVLQHGGRLSVPDAGDQVDAIEGAAVAMLQASSHASSTPAWRSVSTASIHRCGTVICGMSAMSFRAMEALGRTMTPA